MKPLHSNEAIVHLNIPQMSILEEVSDWSSDLIQMEISDIFIARDLKVQSNIDA